MPRKKQKRKSKLGLAPGTLIFTGVQKMTQATISLFLYDENGCEEKQVQTVQQAIDLVSNFKGTSWMNINGIHDVEIIESLNTYLQGHKLMAEDILSVGQRPKLDEYEGNLLVVLKMFQIDEQAMTLDDEQISIVLKGNLLITFQESTGDVFEGVRKRLREGKGFIRKRKADYLLYALIDSVVDYYFLILEKFGEKIEALETSLLKNPDRDLLENLYAIRREMMELRRSVYPLREVVKDFDEIEEQIVSKDTKLFIRDLYDHTIQVVETIEVFRDMISGMLDLYMNSISNRMNEIMKVLTVMASIFIPLTFIVGVYGMNFDVMPELHYKYGYFVIWGIMIALSLVMLYYFKRKKWL